MPMGSLNAIGAQEPGRAGFKDPAHEGLSVDAKWASQDAGGQAQHAMAHGSSLVGLMPARERLRDRDERAELDDRQGEQAQQQRDQRQDLQHVQDGAQEAPVVHLRRV